MKIEDNDYDDDDDHDDHHEKPLLKALLSELSERLKIHSFYYLLRLRISL